MKMNVTTKQLTPGDTVEFIEMLCLFEEIFEMKDFKMPGEDYLKNLLGDENFIVYAAILKNRVVGGLTAYILPSYYNESSEVYIYDVAVKASYQRNGVGKQLLQALAVHCRRHDYKNFFVQADEIDAHALAFYRSTGGSPERVVHFNYKISGEAANKK
jgi:aminoglycoside 3-N-acetyltransferase I